jgi:hypothetical protein
MNRVVVQYSLAIDIREARKNARLGGRRPVAVVFLERADLGVKGAGNVGDCGYFSSPMAGTTGTALRIMDGS